MPIRTTVTPRLASFDLAALDGLEESPSLLLIVSERTQYLLNNFVNLDIRQPERFATDYEHQAYQPLRPSDTDDYALFESVVAGAQLELIPMADDISTLLENIDKHLFPKEAHQQIISGLAGSATQIDDFTEVEGTELWKLSGVTARVEVGPCSYVAFQSYIDGAYGWVDLVLSPVVGTAYSVNEEIWLGPGDWFRIFWGGCTTSVTNRAGIVRWASFEL